MKLLILLVVLISLTYIVIKLGNSWLGKGGGRGGIYNGRGRSNSWFWGSCGSSCGSSCGGCGGGD